MKTRKQKEDEIFERIRIAVIMLGITIAMGIALKYGT